MSSKGSSGGVGIVGGIAVLAIVMAIIQAITALVTAIVNLLMVVALIALFVGVIGAVYWFLIRPNTLQGQRERQLNANLHHEAILQVYARCNAIEREIVLHNDILGYQKTRLQLELKRLQTDIEVHRLPITELEMRLRQVEILFQSMGSGGNGGYTHYEEYTR